MMESLCANFDKRAPKTILLRCLVQISVSHEKIVFVFLFVFVFVFVFVFLISIRGDRKLCKGSFVALRGPTGFVPGEGVV